MTWRFQWFYRAGLLGLAGVLFWSVWANAQIEATNVPAVTNAPPSARAAASTLVDQLANSEEHYLTFGLDRIAVLKSVAVLGQPLWKYGASLIYILLAFLGSKLLDNLVNRWLKKLTQRTETKLDDLLLALLHGPVKVVAFVIFLHIGLNVFAWPPGAKVWLSRLLILVVAGSLTYVAVKVVDLLIGVWQERTVSERDKAFRQQLIPVARTIGKAFVLMLAVLLTASNLGVNITSLLASLSIGGLAVGLAAQDSLANLFGAVAVYLDRPFHLGDRVRIEAVDGTVEAIGLRCTRIRNLDGHLVAIPNKIVGTAVITNISLRPNIKTEINIGLTYDTPPERVRQATEILREIFGGDPHTDDLIIGFNKFMDSSLNLLVIHYWKGTDYKSYIADLQRLNLQVKERFDAEGLNFAFPSQTVYHKADADLLLRPVAKT
jgi:MscS family membrane protein